MPKKESDILIYRLKEDNYWAHPSPFAAHGRGFEIQFKNLAADPIEIDLRGVPVHGQSLTLAAGAEGSVFVDDDAKRGGYVYKAHVLVPPRIPRGKLGKKNQASMPPRRVAIKGGSPPRIVVDT